VPKSKQNQKRKQKLKKRNDKFEALITKRVKKFKALPLEDQVALMDHWQQFSNKSLDSGAEQEGVRGPVGQLGGVTIPVDKEEE